MQSQDGTVRSDGIAVTHSCRPGFFPAQFFALSPSRYPLRGRQGVPVSSVYSPPLNFSFMGLRDFLQPKTVTDTTRAGARPVRTRSGLSPRAPASAGGASPTLPPRLQPGLQSRRGTGEECMLPVHSGPHVRQPRRTGTIRRTRT